ncbi:MAG: beta-galactosidase, partial [Bacteroidales bacterium]|nr:beta-galactosidase [Bacteroidales bacterium]
WTKQHDPTRLVNSASGGNHFLKAGDILDLHNYPQPAMYLTDAKRVNVLGEYGGIGMPLEGHLWTPDRNWGYVKFTTPEEVTDEYVKYALQLQEMVDRGFAAAIYTQTTDVEIEVNGLMTYDRKVDKVDIPRVRAINQQVIKSMQ